MIQEFRVGPHRLLFDLQPEQFMSDHNLLWYAQNRQLPEPEVIAVLLRALKPGDCAVDAGANVGFFTVLMSKIVGETGKIIAIEPDPRNAAKLSKNLDVNSCVNVQVIQTALGNDVGQAALWTHEDNGQSSIYGDTHVGDKMSIVAVQPLDAFIKGRPRLLKMDIEGSEVNAFKGCTYDFPCIVTEVNEKALRRAGHSAADLYTIMRERGYHRYQLHADGSMPSRLEFSQSVKLTRENANMLFAPRDYVARNLWPEVEI